MCLTQPNQENLIQTENFKNSHSRNLLKNRGTLEWWFTRDAAEADEDGGGGDEEYEIKALRKTVGSGGKGRDNVATYENKE